MGMALQHGTTIEVADGYVQRVVSACDRALCTMTWGDEGLVRAALRLPDHSEVVVEAGRGEHPVFGAVDLLRREGTGEELAYCGRIDWRDPGSIPPLDRPGALPTGAGAAVLNLIAIVAGHAGREVLRYRGPYATAALFDALLASFTVEGALPDVLARFCEDSERTAVIGTMREAPVDFVPAPHEWSWPDERVCLQQRLGVERIYVDGVAFERNRRGPRRVIEEGGRAVAAIVLGGEIWARVAAIDRHGALVSGPTPLPDAPVDRIGEKLPAEVTSMLGSVVEARATELLQPVVRELFGELEVSWGDPGLGVAQRRGDGVELHAGLADALPSDPQRLMAVLLELVEPIALGLAQARLADAHDTMLRR